MKTMIYVPEYKRTFETLADAADYLTEQTEAEAAEIRCINEEGRTMYIDGMERNEKSGFFVYNAYYLGIANTPDDFDFINSSEWIGEYNTENEALQSDKATEALMNGKCIRVDLVTALVATTCSGTIEIVQKGEVIRKI